MRTRVVTLALVCLVLGMLTTVGVAWCSAIFVSPFKTPARAVTQNYGDAGVPIGTSTNYARWGLNIFTMDTVRIHESMWLDPGGRVGFEFMMAGGLVPQSTMASYVPDSAAQLIPPDPPMSQREEHMRSVDSRGWPMLAMWSARDRDTVNMQWQAVDYRWCIRISPGKRDSSGTYDRALPLGVHWLGFAANTGLYTAAYFIPLMLYRWIRYGRKWRRRKNNQCIKCGYPIGASPVCTECGADVSKQMRAVNAPAGEH